jgi:hypothetical protein
MFWGANFHICQLEKYDSDTNKISTASSKIFSQDIKGFLNYLLSYPVCCQIWLKVLVDDYQF